MFEYIADAQKIFSVGPASVAQFVGPHPVKRKVTSWIPSQHICLGCRFVPWVGATDRCFCLASKFLSLCFSLPSLLSKNKERKYFKEIFIIE